MTENQIEEIIKNWIKENYSESEINNPSWNIKLLAKELYEKII